MIDPREETFDVIVEPIPVPVELGCYLGSSLSNGCRGFKYRVDILGRIAGGKCQAEAGSTIQAEFTTHLLGSESEDLLGHRQVPHVVKIGPRDLIGSERAAFERIEAVLGNSAPSVTDFADLGERGAIKYRYASMGGGFSTTF